MQVSANENTLSFIRLKSRVWGISWPHVGLTLAYRAGWR